MKKIEFIKSVFQISELPDISLPEIVLCGRSNVGKSSFINSLFNRKNLAKTSSQPGKTRSINFYRVEDTFLLVDLPGFGYAKVSKTEKEKWAKLIEGYFVSGRNIVLALHIVDSRHKPMPLDIELNKYLLEAGFPYNIILNKVDKLKQGELQKSKKTMKQYFPELLPGENMLTYSAVTGSGKPEIRQRLSKIFDIS